MKITNERRMSDEQLKAFREAIQTDNSLQDKLMGATDADSIARIAKEAGFEITADEVKSDQVELSEEQMEGVAGAGYPGSGKFVWTLDPNGKTGAPKWKGDGAFKYGPYPGLKPTLDGYERWGKWADGKWVGE